MTNFWKLVNDLLDESDLVLEVLDARFVEQSRNKEIERKVNAREKKLLIVINKCDLVPKDYLDMVKKQISKEYPIVFVSTKEHLGTTMLKKEIFKHLKTIPGKIAVVGYPNTGKSSVINVLKGKAVAGTSVKAGFTKGVQWVKIDKDIMLLDSPGVIPFEEHDEMKHALLSSVTPDKIKNPDLVAVKILELVSSTNKLLIEHFFGVPYREDLFLLLEDIAVKRHRLLRGSVPDIDTISRMIIQDWQSGKINLVK